MVIALKPGRNGAGERSLHVNRAAICLVLDLNRSATAKVDGMNGPKPKRNGQGVARCMVIALKPGRRAKHAASCMVIALKPWPAGSKCFGGRPEARARRR